MTFFFEFLGQFIFSCFSISKVLELASFDPIPAALKQVWANICITEDIHQRQNILQIKQTALKNKTFELIA